MGASVGPNKGGAKSDINVTPLIDIVLVLLIVFIVMVPGLSKAHKAAIPQVQTVTTPPPPSKENPPIVVTVDKDGKFFLQQDEVKLQELPDKLLDPVMKQTYGERKVILKVEEDIPFQYAVSAMDMIRRASDMARKKTSEGNQLQDGGDVKVAISMKKKDMK
jgi:biopolymer transport protein TolR